MKAADNNTARFDRNIGYKIEAKIIKVATIMLIIMMKMAGKINHSLGKLVEE